MKNQTFVFLHDENLYFKNKKKFDCFDNLKYVFLGAKNVDQIENFNDVIIARNLPQNIEKHKNLTAYTGWYVLWKNNLIEGEYVNFFEYDIIFRNDIQNIIYETFKKFPKIKSVSYQPLSLHGHWFLGSNLVAEPFLDRLKHYYGFDGRQFINNFPSNAEVGVTSNQTLEKNTFKSFMKWVEPIIDDVKYNYMAGHYPERCLPLFVLQQSLDSIICDNLLYHIRLDSHGTQGITEKHKLVNYARVLKLQSVNENISYKKIKKLHI